MQSEIQGFSPTHAYGSGQRILRGKTRNLHDYLVGPGIDLGEQEPSVRVGLPVACCLGVDVNGGYGCIGDDGAAAIGYGSSQGAGSSTLRKQEMSRA